MMDKKERVASNLELLGGRLCLDFTNTVSTRIETLHHEYLTSYSDLVAWSRHVGVLTGDEAQVLLRNAARHPEQASSVLEQAIALRETMYRIFSAVVNQQAPERADLAALNAALHKALARLGILPSADGFGWTWVRDQTDFDQMLWPIVRSAADLLTDSDLSRVRQCAREGCDWLFVDSSKNHSRRWCTMKLCGSRVKAHRYYHRRRSPA